MNQPIAEKYSLEPLGSGFMVFSPGVQLAGANLVRVGLHVLEGLQNPQGLINVAAHRQVVDGGMHDHTIGIDDEQTTQSNALSVIEDVVGRRFPSSGRQRGDS